MKEGIALFVCIIVGDFGCWLIADGFGLKEAKAFLNWIFIKAEAFGYWLIAAIRKKQLSFLIGESPKRKYFENRKKLQLNTQKP